MTCRLIDRSLLAFVTALVVLAAVNPRFAMAQVTGTISGNGVEAQRAAARRAAVASARGNVEAAQARLKAAEERIKAEAKANPEFAAAEKELDDAQADLKKFSEPVLEKLKNDSDYQAALKDEQDAARTLAAEHAKAVAADPASTQPTTGPATAKPDDGVGVEQAEQSLNVPVPTDGQAVAAVDKIDSRSRRREIEMKAIEADPNAGAAQARMDAATAKLKQFRAELDAKMLNDGEYKAARDQLATAKADMTRAAAANY